MAAGNSGAGPFLTAPQVAEQLGYSTDTVRRMWTDGTLPMVRINGRRRTPAAALDQWISQKATEALAAVKE